MRKRRVFFALILGIVLMGIVFVSGAEVKQDLERVDFVHHAKPFGAKAAITNQCYKLMGVKWGVFPVSYVINPTNNLGLDVSFINSSIAISAETWDERTSKELFNNEYTMNPNVYYGNQDFTNAISFGSYPQSGVIAVTSVWFSRKTKQIVEFDLLFNDFYSWGDASIDNSKMDLQNIATHELGHAIGLSDIYNAGCNSVTMYGYSNSGDLQKRTLEQPDIFGLQKMYGI